MAYRRTEQRNEMANNFVVAKQMFTQSKFTRNTTGVSSSNTSHRSVQEMHKQTTSGNYVVSETRSVTRTVRTQGQGGEWKTVTVENFNTTGGDFDGFQQGFSTQATQTREMAVTEKFSKLSIPSEKEEKDKKKGLFAGLLKSKGETKAASLSVSAGDFEKHCLEAHNKCRAKHGVAPLKLSKDLCKYATEWATKLAKEDRFMHRPNNKYGENIYMKWTSDPTYNVTGQEPVESWYSEIKDHVFYTEPRSLKSGHFTQVIWQGSRELGVAFAKSSTGKILVVANYNPAGNMMGDFSKNVPPLKN